MTRRTLALAETTDGPGFENYRMKTLPRILLLVLLVLAAQGVTLQARAQGRPAAGVFRGDWNWAVYAKDKSELPPAYQSMDVKQVPAYALDLTIRQKGGRLTAKCGVLARFLAKLDNCDFVAAARGGVARVSLKSSFGGTATVMLTLRGNRLHWKVIKRTGESYYPDDVVLRRLRKGEVPPYAERESTR